MKAVTSTSAANMKSTKLSKSNKYAQITFDYLKHLFGKKHQKYGPSAAIVYVDTCNS
ncbi:hypothetical protein [Solitalea lacus]|uniref:hypothetical protein n=1 Tax=Solitalea lacus TaxID=2911172 RepID=UPI001EDC4EEC|nr:hypothetical protein [Solitalea lacus]UKJ07030.1 hypothetical protein L2B55_16060 [Solitalea lacus]